MVFKRAIYLAYPAITTSHRYWDIIAIAGAEAIHTHFPLCSE